MEQSKEAADGTGSDPASELEIVVAGKTRRFAPLPQLLWLEAEERVRAMKKQVFAEAIAACKDLVPEAAKTVLEMAFTELANSVVFGQAEVDLYVMSQAGLFMQFEMSLKHLDPALSTDECREIYAEVSASQLKQLDAFWVSHRKAEL